jgi:hypothetical protein
MENELGCGVPEHNAECLCDVIIRQPLPPLEDCIKDGVSDMWFGREVCDMRGYSAPWTDETILAYFEDLTKFYDAFHYQQPHGGVVSSIEDCDKYQHDGLPLFAQWSWIRETVQYVMDRFDNSLCETIKVLNIDPQNLIDALTTGKAGTDWDYEMIDRLDKSFMESTISLADIARTNNLSTGTVRGLSKYWEKRRKRLLGSDNPARDRMHWLCRNTELTPREIVDIVYREHGFLYAKSSISKCRSRIKRGNPSL